MAEPIVIRKDIHKSARILNGGNLLFAASDTVCPLVLLELAKVSKQAPIIFLNAETEECSVFALQGFTEGRNYFVNEIGSWKANYIPFHYRVYPFMLVSTADTGQKVLCIHKDNHLLSFDKMVDANDLFQADGEPTPYLTNILKLLNTLEESKKITQAAIDTIRSFDLLDELDLKIKRPDTEQSINGLWKINQKKFGELDQKQLMDLMNVKALDLIYAHLFSLDNLSDLAKLTQPNTAKPSNSNISLKDRAVEKQKVENKKELDDLVKNLLIDD
jgi:hypothetical protein